MSGNRITLVTAEERELWRDAIVAATRSDAGPFLTTDGAVMQLEEVADAAVRAYRERLPAEAPQPVDGDGGTEPCRDPNCDTCEGAQREECIACGALVDCPDGESSDYCQGCASDPGSQTPDAPGWWWVRSGRELTVDGWAPVCVELHDGQLMFDEQCRGGFVSVRSYAWGGPCTRGDAGDASKLQAGLTALRERLGELADGLRRRHRVCDDMALNCERDERVNQARCSGKASAYGHAAELLREALREDS